MSSPIRNTSTALALALFATSCGGDGREAADVEQFYVDHGEESLELTQRFDGEGELVETVLVHRNATDERVVRALGPLMTADGATDGGVHVRRFLSTMDPAMLARLHRAGLRWDLAVLTADAMLALDSRGQRAAARQLADGPVDTELCVLLGACADAPDGPTPRT